MDKIRIVMPQKVADIINELNSAGYEAYAVGGCVRDSILGRKPNDWDITTSAMPEEVKAIFRRTVDTGIKHGTVTVLLGDDSFEVTTFRVDGEYTDHRHPEEVSFTRNLEEDLLRRDFTINAMAYSDKTGIVDLYGGLQDIENKVIKAVGDPDARFDEDALRIMRAVRFAAKLITSAHPEKLIDAYELGITAVILPEFDNTMGVPQNNPYHKYDVGHHIIAVTQNVPPTKIMRYTALFHDICKPECRTTDERGIDHFKMHAVLGADKAREIMRRLKMDNESIHAVSRLIYWHDYGIKGDVTKRSLRRMMSKLGAENFPDYLAIRRADMAGQSDFRKGEKDEIYRNIEALYNQIIAEGDCLSVKDLAINGGDIMKLGIPAGPKIGEILTYLLERVMDEPSLNTHEQLLALAREYL